MLSKVRITMRLHSDQLYRVAYNFFLVLELKVALKIRLKIRPPAGVAGVSGRTTLNS